MTLLVGIFCADPDQVVIATDRQVTLGALGTITVGQSGTKAILMSGQAIFATSGAVGLAQQIAAIIQNEHGKFGTSKYADCAQQLQTKIRALINPALEIAQKAAGVIGLQAAAMDALCTGLLAARFADGVRLVEISQQGGFESMTSESVPFTCHGSGKNNADPFLRFLWNVYWHDRRPTLREAILAAYWTIKCAIELKTSGVGFGVDVFVLEKAGAGGKHVRARQFEAAELREHDEFIDAAQQAMRSVRDRVTDQTAPAGEPAAPPPPTLDPTARQ